MRLIRAAVGVAMVAVVMEAAGCGSDPVSPSARSIAEHFDSLYSRALAAHTGGDSARAVVLSYLELAAAYGATPTPVTITTASGPKRWNALSIEVADTSGSPSATTTHITVVYSDANVKNAVRSVVTVGATTTSAANLFADDTIRVIAASPGVVMSDASHGGGCKTPPTLANPGISQAASYHCALATFRASLTANFAATPGVDSSLRSISYTNVTVRGVRFTNATP